MHNRVNVLHNSAIGSFVSAMSQALCHLDKDGRMTAEDVCILRQAIAKIPNGRRLSGVVELNKYFGPFESLSVEAQHPILRAIMDDERWRMAGYDLCGWHFAITRIMQTLYLKLLQYRLSRMAGLIHLLADVARKGPRWMLHAIYRRQLRWKGKFYRRPTLEAVLNISGTEPWNFAVCYARNIPQPVRYRGFWHDLSRHNTVGVVLGIDLIPTPEGFWYAESNLNCGPMPERTALYNHDPFVSNLLDFVKEQGYRHLVVMADNFQYVDKLMAKQYKEGADRFVFRFISRIICENARVVTALSRNLKKLAEKTFNEIDIEIIYNGVDTDKFKPVVNKSGFNIDILFVGRLIRRKGIINLLKAFKEVCDEYENCELTIVGGGPKRKYLENFCKRMKIESNVNFLGAVEYRDIDKIYQKAGIFVLPSLEESLSNVIQEAMASGLPIITTDTGAAELIDENGFIVDKGDYKQIKKAIMEYISSPELMRKHGQQSRKVAEKMSWSNNAKAYIEIYNSVK